MQVASQGPNVFTGKKKTALESTWKWKMLLNQFSKWILLYLKQIANYRKQAVELKCHKVCTILMYLVQTKGFFLFNCLFLLSLKFQVGADFYWSIFPHAATQRSAAAAVWVSVFHTHRSPLVHINLSLNKLSSRGEENLLHLVTHTGYVSC